MDESTAKNTDEIGGRLTRRKRALPSLIVSALTRLSHPALYLLLTVFAVTSASTPLVAQSSGVNFASSGSYTAGSGAFAIVAGDFNNDGKPDIVVVNNRSNAVSVLISCRSFRWVRAIQAALLGRFEQRGVRQQAV